MMKDFQNKFQYSHDPKTMPYMKLGLETYRDSDRTCHLECDPCSTTYKRKFNRNQCLIPKHSEQPIDIIVKEKCSGFGCKKIGDGRAEYKILNKNVYTHMPNTQLAKNTLNVVSKAENRNFITARNHKQENDLETIMPYSKRKFSKKKRQFKPTPKFNTGKKYYETFLKSHVKRKVKSDIELGQAKSEYYAIGDEMILDMFPYEPKSTKYLPTQSHSFSGITQVFRLMINQIVDNKIIEHPCPSCNEPSNRIEMKTHGHYQLKVGELNDKIYTYANANMLLDQAEKMNQGTKQLEDKSKTCHKYKDAQDVPHIESGIISVGRNTNNTKISSSSSFDTALREILNTVDENHCCNIDKLDRAKSDQPGKSIKSDANVKRQLCTSTNTKALNTIIKEFIKELKPKKGEMKGFKLNTRFKDLKRHKLTNLMQEKENQKQGLKISNQKEYIDDSSPLIEAIMKITKIIQQRKNKSCVENISNKSIEKGKAMKKEKKSPTIDKSSKTIKLEVDKSQTPKTSNELNQIVDQNTRLKLLRRSNKVIRSCSSKTTLKKFNNKSTERKKMSSPSLDKAIMELVHDFDIQMQSVCACPSSYSQALHAILDYLNAKQYGKKASVNLKSNSKYSKKRIVNLLNRIIKWKSDKSEKLFENNILHKFYGHASTKPILYSINKDENDMKNDTTHKMKSTFVEIGHGISEIDAKTYSSLGQREKAADCMINELNIAHKISNSPNSSVSSKRTLLYSLQKLKDRIDRKNEKPINQKRMSKSLSTFNLEIPVNEIKEELSIKNELNSEFKSEHSLIKVLNNFFETFLKCRCHVPQRPLRTASTLELNKAINEIYNKLYEIQQKRPDCKIPGAYSNVLGKIIKKLASELRMRKKAIELDGSDNGLKMKASKSSLEKAIDYLMHDLDINQETKYSVERTSDNKETSGTTLPHLNDEVEESTLKRVSKSPSVSTLVKFVEKNEQKIPREKKLIPNFKSEHSLIKVLDELMQNIPKRNCQVHRRPLFAVSSAQLEKTIDVIYSELKKILEERQQYESPVIYTNALGNIVQKITSELDFRKKILISQQNIPTLKELNDGNIDIKDLSSLATLEKAIDYVKYELATRHKIKTTFKGSLGRVLPRLKDEVTRKQSTLKLVSRSLSKFALEKPVEEIEKELPIKIKKRFDLKSEHSLVKALNNVIKMLPKRISLVHERPLRTISIPDLVKAINEIHNELNKRKQKRLGYESSDTYANVLSSIMKKIASELYLRTKEEQPRSRRRHDKSFNESPYLSDLKKAKKEVQKKLNDRTRMKDGFKSPGTYTKALQKVLSKLTNEVGESKKEPRTLKTYGNRVPSTSLSNLRKCDQKLNCNTSHKNAGLKTNIFDTELINELMKIDDKGARAQNLITLSRLERSIKLINNELDRRNKSRPSCVAPGTISKVLENEVKNFKSQIDRMKEEFNPKILSGSEINNSLKNGSTLTKLHKVKMEIEKELDARNNIQMDEKIPEVISEALAKALEDLDNAINAKISKTDLENGKYKTKSNLQELKEARKVLKKELRKRKKLRLETKINTPISVALKNRWRKLNTKICEIKRNLTNKVCRRHKKDNVNDSILKLENFKKNIKQELDARNKMRLGNNIPGAISQALAYVLDDLNNVVQMKKANSKHETNQNKSNQDAVKEAKNHLKKELYKRNNIRSKAETNSPISVALEKELMDLDDKIDEITKGLNPKVSRSREKENKSDSILKLKIAKMEIKEELDTRNYTRIGNKSPGAVSIALANEFDKISNIIQAKIKEADPKYEQYKKKYNLRALKEARKQLKKELDARKNKRFGTKRLSPISVALKKGLVELNKKIDDTKKSPMKKIPKKPKLGDIKGSLFKLQNARMDIKGELVARNNMRPDNKSPGAISTVLAKEFDNLSNSIQEKIKNSDLKYEQDKEKSNLHALKEARKHLNRELNKRNKISSVAKSPISVALDKTLTDLDNKIDTITRSHNPDVLRRREKEYKNNSIFKLKLAKMEIKEEIDARNNVRPVNKSPGTISKALANEFDNLSNDIKAKIIKADQKYELDKNKSNLSALKEARKHLNKELDTRKKLNFGANSKSPISVALKKGLRDLNTKIDETKRNETNKLFKIPKKSDVNDSLFKLQNAKMDIADELVARNNMRPSNKSLGAISKALVNELNNLNNAMQVKIKIADLEYEQDINKYNLRTLKEDRKHLKRELNNRNKINPVVKKYSPISVALDKRLAVLDNKIDEIRKTLEKKYDSDSITKLKKKKMDIEEELKARAAIRSGGSSPGAISKVLVNALEDTTNEIDTKLDENRKKPNLHALKEATRDIREELNKRNTRNLRNKRLSPISKALEKGLRDLNYKQQELKHSRLSKSLRRRDSDIIRNSTLKLQKAYMDIKNELDSRNKIRLVDQSHGAISQVLANELIQLNNAIQRKIKKDNLRALEDDRKYLKKELNKRNKLNLSTKISPISKALAKELREVDNKINEIKRNLGLKVRRKNSEQKVRESLSVLNEAKMEIEKELDNRNYLGHDESPGAVSEALANALEDLNSAINVKTNKIHRENKKYKSNPNPQVLKKARKDVKKELQRRNKLSSGNKKMSPISVALDKELVNLNNKIDEIKRDQGTPKHRHDKNKIRGSISSFDKAKTDEEDDSSVTSEELVKEFDYLTNSTPTKLRKINPKYTQNNNKSDLRALKKARKHVKKELNKRKKLTSGNQSSSPISIALENELKDLNNKIGEKTKNLTPKLCRRNRKARVHDSISKLNKAKNKIKKELNARDYMRPADKSLGAISKALDNELNNLNNSINTKLKQKKIKYDKIKNKANLHALKEAKKYYKKQLNKRNKINSGIKSSSPISVEIEKELKDLNNKIAETKRVLTPKVSRKRKNYDVTESISKLKNAKMDIREELDARNNMRLGKKSPGAISKALANELDDLSQAIQAKIQKVDSRNEHNKNKLNLRALKKAKKQVEKEINSRKKTSLGSSSPITEALENGLRNLNNKIENTKTKLNPKLINQKENHNVSDSVLKLNKVQMDEWIKKDIDAKNNMNLSNKSVRAISEALAKELDYLNNSMQAKITKVNSKYEKNKNKSNLRALRKARKLLKKELKKRKTTSWETKKSSPISVALEKGVRDLNVKINELKKQDIILKDKKIIIKKYLTQGYDRNSTNSDLSRKHQNNLNKMKQDKREDNILRKCLKKFKAWNFFRKSSSKQKKRQTQDSSYIDKGVLEVYVNKKDGSILNPDEVFQRINSNEFNKLGTYKETPSKAQGGPYLQNGYRNKLYRNGEVRKVSPSSIIIDDTLRKLKSLKKIRYLKKTIPRSDLEGVSSLSPSKLSILLRKLDSAWNKRNDGQQLLVPDLSDLELEQLINELKNIKRISGDRNNIYTDKQDLLHKIIINKNDATLVNADEVFGQFISPEKSKSLKTAMVNHDDPIKNTKSEYSMAWKQKQERYHRPDVIHRNRLLDGMPEYSKPHYGMQMHYSNDTAGSELLIGIKDLGSNILIVDRPHGTFCQIKGGPKNIKRVADNKKLCGKIPRDVMPHKVPQYIYDDIKHTDPAELPLCKNVRERTFYSYYCHCPSMKQKNKFTKREDIISDVRDEAPFNEIAYDGKYRGKLQFYHLPCDKRKRLFFKYPGEDIEYFKLPGAKKIYHRSSGNKMRIFKDPCDETTYYKLLNDPKLYYRLTGDETLYYRIPGDPRVYYELPNDKKVYYKYPGDKTIYYNMADEKITLVTKGKKRYYKFPGDEKVYYTLPGDDSIYFQIPNDRTTYFKKPGDERTFYKLPKDNRIYYHLPGDVTTYFCIPGDNLTYYKFPGEDTIYFREPGDRNVYYKLPGDEAVYYDVIEDKTSIFSPSSKTRVRKKSIAHKARFGLNTDPCICGSIECKNDWLKYLKLRASNKANKSKCICGSENCGNQSHKVMVDHVKAKKYEKVKKLEDKLKKQKKKNKKLQEKKRLQQEKKILRKRQKEERLRCRRIRKVEKRAIRPLKKKLCCDCVTSDKKLAAESLLDIGKLSATGLFNLLRSTCKAVTQPKQSVRSIKTVVKHPRRFIGRCRNKLVTSGYYDTRARVKYRLSSMRRVNQIAKNIESHPCRKFWSHKCNGKKQPRKIKRMPMDFNCSLYMASLRKTPYLGVYFMCPWFYPHCVSLFVCWKRLLEVSMFVLALLVWSPCILCLELARAIMCCTSCTG